MRAWGYDHKPNHLLLGMQPSRGEKPNSSIERFDENAQNQIAKMD
jgi:hypothetical protein